MIRKIRAFTLLELLIVVVIIGILATVALPAYRSMRESALDKEAHANLKAIQAAQKIYHMETNSYKGCLGAWDSDQEKCIRDELKVPLPAGGPTDTPTWDYETYGDNASASISGCSHASRPFRSGGNGRAWHLHIGSEEPQSGGCH